MTDQTQDGDVIVEAKEEDGVIDLGRVTRRVARDDKWTTMAALARDSKHDEVHYQTNRATVFAFSQNTGANANAPITAAGTAQVPVMQKIIGSKAIAKSDEVFRAMAKKRGSSGSGGRGRGA